LFCACYSITEYKKSQLFNDYYLAGVANLHLCCFIYMADDVHINYELVSALYKRWSDQPLSAREADLIEQWLSASPDNERLLEEIADADVFRQNMMQFKSIEPEVIWDKVMKLRKSVSGEIKPARKFRYLRTAWLRYAAAAVVAFAVSVYFWMSVDKNEMNARRDNTIPVAAEVVPGSDKAILTLGSGKKIELDPSSQQTITDGDLLIRNDRGMLTYEKTDVVSYNTIATPRGGQYRLVLPDGTLVWLNAASSITYPTVFSGGQREIAMTGEGYFEVAKDLKKPFRVNIRSELSVEVLGTHFNINSYTDESNIRTSLLEGSVKVVYNGNSKVLARGQQALIDRAADSINSIKVVSNIDLDAVVAWKNGYFSFRNADMYTIMRQISRWYDVEVVYEGEATDRRFRGKISRRARLPEVLEILEESKVHFRMDGRKIIVQPDKF